MILEVKLGNCTSTVNLFWKQKTLGKMWKE